MTEQYTQTVEVKTSNADKAKLFLGIALLMLSLVFMILGIMKNRLYFIGFGVLFVLGMLLVQIFESSPSEFIYGLSAKSLVIAKKNNAHNTKRIARIDLEKVVRIERFSDIVDKKDLIACSDVSDANVFAIIFVEEIRQDDEQKQVTKRLLISPDDYLLALFAENFKNKFVGEETDEQDHIS